MAILYLHIIMLYKINFVLNLIIVYKKLYNMNRIILCIKYFYHAFTIVRIIMMLLCSIT